jgi:hypothetical protein
MAGYGEGLEVVWRKIGLEDVLRRVLIVVYGRDDCERDDEAGGGRMETDIEKRSEAGTDSITRPEK